MSINSLNNNVNFKGVYVVASQNKQMNSLKEKLEDINEPYMNYHLSDFDYRKHKDYNWFKQAQKEGKTIDVFVTGSRDCASILLREPGWHSVKEIARKATSFFDLSKDSVSDIINKVIDED